MTAETMILKFWALSVSWIVIFFFFNFFLMQAVYVYLSQLISLSNVACALVSLQHWMTQGDISWDVQLILVIAIQSPDGIW